MKKVTAFITALALAGCSVLGMHVFASQKLDFHNPAFGYWTADQKFRAPSALRANLTSDTLVVLASSELEHGKNTPYHPQNIFKDNTFSTMLIGAGHYQSLSHAITLAALEPDMKKRKVALLVSPQWFRKKGVEPGAYSSRFSESSLLAMLDNDKLSEKTKSYIMNRSINLLSADKKTQERVKDYKKLYLDGETNPLLQTKYKLYKDFLYEKEKQSILSLAYLNGIKRNPSLHLSSSEPDWEAYRTQAVENAKTKTDNNEFQISNVYFKRKIKPKLKERKNSSLTSSYSVSPEYDDLRCFLDVCKELDIEPLLVLLPVNGKWYDYTAFPKERRQEFYNNVHKVAEEYDNVQIADFGDDDYTDYFMQDTIHIGWKGWVSVDEVLYKFGN